MHERQLGGGHGRSPLRRRQIADQGADPRAVDEPLPGAGGVALRQRPRGHVTFGVAHDAAVRVVKWYAVFAVISVGLWLWMANRNAAGRNWARTVATVLFAVFTLETASTVMLNLHTRGSTPGITVLDVVGWLVALAATLCLWRRDASQYFEQYRYR